MATAIETIAACLAALSEASQALTGALGNRRTAVPEVVEALRLVGQTQSRLLAVEQEIRRHEVTVAEQMQALERENQRLRSQLEGEVRYERNAYWRLSAAGAQDGPFCSNCWDTQRRLVRMHEKPTSDFATCPTCDKPVKVYEGLRSPRRGPSFRAL